MILRVLLLCVATLCLLLSHPVPAAATGSNPDRPDYSHVSESDLDSIFFAFARPDTPGCAVSVACHGEQIFARGYGIANLDYGVPIRPDSRFMVASVSKQFAAAALMMMAQEGVLDLDVDLRTYIPELPKFEKPITARQVIHHTSGLRDIYDLLALADIGLDNTTTNEDALAMIGRQQRLNFDPGTGFLYSNSGYFLMSVLTRNITGMSLRDYTHKHFFEPIGMHATHWHDDTGMIVPNRVISYRPTPLGAGQFYRGNMDRVGARGLFTTVEDFVLWDANFIENRTHLENFTEVMSRPGSTTRRDSINYATGLRHGVYRDLVTLGHGGSYMGFRTNYMRFPELQLAITVFCNKSDISPAAYSRQIADLYLRNVFAERFADLVGTYRSESLGVSFTVVPENGDLYLKRSGEDFYDDLRRMVWSAGDRFRVDRWTIRFERDDDGHIRHFTLEAPRTGAITFHRE